MATDEAARTPFLQFFQPIADQFAREEVLCHLKSFPQIADDFDPYAPDDEVQTCEKLALIADVVVLDWHLGNQTPTFSSAIIRKIIEDKGTRFIMILSREDNLVTEFEAEFEGDFVKSEDGSYKNSEGVFALLFAKAEFTGADGATRLVEKIFDRMAVTYPDYLHWAAIEIAGRVKLFTPRWLSSLPLDTDLAILAENLHSAEGITEAVIENLLEDLGEALEFSTVESVQPGALKSEDWPNADAFKARLREEISNAEVGLLDNIRKLVPSRLMIKLRLIRRLGRWRSRFLRNLPTIHQLVNLGRAFMLLVSSCESRSSSERSVIRRGSIIIEGDDKELVFVCISQSCDCLREPSLLFVIAKSVAEDHDGKPGETFFRFGKRTYLVAPGASNLKVVMWMSKGAYLRGIRLLDAFERSLSIELSGAMGSSYKGGNQSTKIYTGISKRKAMKRTAIDLFSGCGGLTQGLRDADFRVVACAEIRQEARQTYSLNHPGVFVHDDVRTLSSDVVASKTNIKRGSLDLLAACPPCQGFSSMRTKNKEVALDPRNELIFEVMRLVGELLPKCVLIENVPRLLNDDRIEAFKAGLIPFGYQFTGGVLDAQNFAVPQRRKRMILIGSRLGKIGLPANKTKKITVWDAIGDFAPP